MADLGDILSGRVSVHARPVSELSDGELLAGLEALDALLDVPATGETVHIAFRRLYDALVRVGHIQIEIARRAAVPARIAEVLTVQAGDKVLVATTGRWSMQMADEVTDLLRRRFPEVEFAFVADVASVAVQRSEGATS